MKKSYIIGAAVIVAALVLAISSFRSSLISYVSIAEARTSNRSVQVAGALIEGSVRYDLETNYLYFALKDEAGDTLTIKYNKPKPANMEGAPKIVAIGRFNPQEQLFEANEILVKCPSKYEGNTDKK